QRKRSAGIRVAEACQAFPLPRKHPETGATVYAEGDGTQAARHKVEGGRSPRGEYVLTSWVPGLPAGPDSVSGCAAGEARVSGQFRRCPATVTAPRQRREHGRPAVPRTRQPDRPSASRGAPARSTPVTPDDISPRGKGDPSRQRRASPVRSRRSVSP